MNGYPEIQKSSFVNAFAQARGIIGSGAMGRNKQSGGGNR
jgi:hypothetical protein